MGGGSSPLAHSLVLLEREAEPKSAKSGRAAKSDELQATEEAAGGR